MQQVEDNERVVQKKYKKSWKGVEWPDPKEVEDSSNKENRWQCQPEGNKQKVGRAWCKDNRSEARAGKYEQSDKIDNQEQIRGQVRIEEVEMIDIHLILAMRENRIWIYLIH